MTWCFMPMATSTVALQLSLRAGVLMLIVDAHLDLAWNALQWNRELLQSVYTIRTREAAVPGKARAQNTVALPELRQGRVVLCFATLLARSTGHPVPHVDFASPLQAYAVAYGQLMYYRALSNADHVRIITDADELEAHLAVWNTPALHDSEAPPPLGLVLSMESADPILLPERVGEWHGVGIRIIGPAHQGSGQYAGGTGVETGLTSAGLALLTEMQHHGIILDLTHLSDAAFWEALDRFHGTVIASHNNCRALVPHQRQLSDAQLKAIIKRNGIIGVALDAWMLQPGWIKGVSTNERVTLNHVADHIDHICQLAGSSSHAAIGSDLDGGFGREQSPHDLDTIADLQKLVPTLQQRGYTENDLRAILHGNWLNLLRRAWRVAE